jgi:hypothetical protein
MQTGPENQRTNVLSIVTLVMSVLGFAVVPVITGHISLAQIRRTGEQGRVMAIIGLVIGYLSLAGYLIIAAILIVILLNHGMSSVY